MPSTRLNTARERLLDSATYLFNARGINATGIDEVIERAGVAKASLYNNFEGKDDLVAAYLERQLSNFVALLEEIDESFWPSQRVDQFFLRVKVGAARRHFRGCPFSKASVEIKLNSPGARVIRRFYEQLERFFAAALNTTSSDERVRQLVILYDGAMTNAKVLRDPTRVDAAVSLARKVAER